MAFFFEKACQRLYGHAFLSACFDMGFDGGRRRVLHYAGRLGVFRGCCVLREVSLFHVSFDGGGIEEGSLIPMSAGALL